MFATPPPHWQKKRKFHSEPTHFNPSPKDPNHTPTQSTFSTAKIPQPNQITNQQNKNKFDKLIPNSLHKFTFHPSPTSKIPPVARSPLFLGIKNSKIVNDPFSSQKSYPLRQPTPPLKQPAANSPSSGCRSVKQRRSIKKFQPARLNGKGCDTFRARVKKKGPKKRGSSAIEPSASSLSVARASQQQGCFHCLLPCKKRKGSPALDSQSSSFVGLVASPKAPPGYP